ncbi:MAG: hydroxypyruvate isomerase family protein [Anaerolineales bacterium]
MSLYAPNISWLLPELPFAERARRIAQAGFSALEFGFPSYADTEALMTLQDEYGFQVILFNQDVPVWDEANRGYLVDPSRRDEFRTKLDEALEIVDLLEVKKVMLPAGVELPELSREEQRECMLENLRYAAPLAERAELIFTIEMLNPIDNPGYYLSSTSQGLEIVAEIDHPHIKFQLDTYHVQLTEGNVIRTLVENMPHIGHIQFADAPGRHEPGTGELDFESIRAAIRNAGYDGYIGLEYIPKAEGMDALAWCQV